MCVLLAYKLLGFHEASFISVFVYEVISLTHKVRTLGRKHSQTSPNVLPHLKKMRVKLSRSKITK